MGDVGEWRLGLPAWLWAQILNLQEPKSSGAGAETVPTATLIATCPAAHGVHDVNAVAWCPRGGFEDLLATMRVDKKARGSQLRFVVLDGIGRPGILADPPEELLRAAYDHLAGVS